jgi:hypothetical protein
MTKQVKNGSTTVQLPAEKNRRMTTRSISGEPDLDTTKRECGKSILLDPVPSPAMGANKTMATTPQAKPLLLRPPTNKIINHPQRPRIFGRRAGKQNGSYPGCHEVLMGRPEVVLDVLLQADVAAIGVARVSVKLFRHN